MLVKKRQTRLDCFEEKILALSVRGMTTRDIQAQLQTNLGDQICDAAGGPCAYLGRDMKTTHTGMGITEAEWTATVEDLVKALNKFKVGQKEQQELLGALGAMKKDIVGQ